MRQESNLKNFTQKFLLKNDAWITFKKIVFEIRNNLLEIQELLVGRY